ncbi:hypothetical protein F4782DRAFT_333282 [Xylaria castorea]|nr:hypothetical protein F4782DRAFT_333282 [Xylaria castorea]
MDFQLGHILTVDPTMDNDRRESLLDSLSATPGINKPAGTSLDPIVLDDDDRDSMAPKSSPGKRTPIFRSTPSRALPKRRGLISINNDVSDGIASPRIFTDILESEDEDKTHLRNELATLQAEVSRLKITLIGVRLDLSGAQLQATNLSVEKSKFLEKIEQLEDLSDHRKGLEDELKCARSENARAKQTTEALQRELVAQRQTVKDHKNKLFETEMKQASLDKGHVEEKLQARLRFGNAYQAYVTMKKKNGELTAELERIKKESIELPALRSQLETAVHQLSTTTRDIEETQEQVSRLQSQLKEAERSSAAFQIQTTQLEHDKTTRKEENEKLIATNTKVHEDMKALQLSLETGKKAYEQTKLERDRAEGELKELTNERAVLWRRIEGLEAEKLEYEKPELERMVEKSVAVARQEASRLSGIELDLQVAQQQIEAMNHHMERCPFVQNTAIWDSCVTISREVFQLLGMSSGGSDESPAESHSPSHDTPGPSSS